MKFCFWPRGRQATALRPAWGSALQPGGRAGAGQAAVCLGSPICEDVRVLYGVSIDTDVDMRHEVGGGVVLLGHLQCGRASQIHLGPTFDLPEVCVNHM